MPSAQAPPPPSSGQLFSISCSFRRGNYILSRRPPTPRLAHPPPPLKILEPPLTRILPAEYCDVVCLVSEAKPLSAMVLLRLISLKVNPAIHKVDLLCFARSKWQRSICLWPLHVIHFIKNKKCINAKFLLFLFIIHLILTWSWLNAGNLQFIIYIIF